MNDPYNKWTRPDLLPGDIIQVTNLNDKGFAFRQERQGHYARVIDIESRAIDYTPDHYEWFVIGKWLKPPNDINFTYWPGRCKKINIKDVEENEDLLVDLL